MPSIELMGRGPISIVRLAMPLAVFAVVASAGTALAATSPVISEKFGSIDPPCPAPANSPNAGSCIAHLYLLNSGAEGSGVATINIALKGAPQPAQCHTLIPPTAAGAFVDVSCRFTMPAGAQVDSPPSVSDITVSSSAGLAASSSGGGNDLTSIAVLALAVVTALLALGTFTVASAARRAATRTPGDGSRPLAQGQRQKPAPFATPEDTYTLPALPR